MNAALLLIPFATPVAVGAMWGGFGWLRTRLHLRRAFAHGRAESVVRLPVQVEPWPDLEVSA